MRRALLTAAAIGCCVTLSGAAQAKGPTVFSFRTPSGKIGCVYSRGMGPRALRCDIATRLRPRPARPKGCRDLDWGDSYSMNVRGRAVVTCHGDTAILPHSKVIAYGKIWSRGGFSCSSRQTGLTCKNSSHHGWFLSREHSYRF